MKRSRMAAALAGPGDRLPRPVRRARRHGAGGDEDRRQDDPGQVAARQPPRGRHPPRQPAAAGTIPATARERLDRQIDARHPRPGPERRPRRLRRHRPPRPDRHRRRPRRRRDRRSTAAAVGCAELATRVRGRLLGPASRARTAVSALEAAAACAAAGGELPQPLTLHRLLRAARRADRRGGRVDRRDRRVSTPTRALRRLRRVSKPTRRTFHLRSPQSCTIPLRDPAPPA